IPVTKKYNPIATGKGLKLLHDYVVAMDPMNTVSVEHTGQCFEVVITLNIAVFSQAPHDIS
ncbi:MAG: hypothetical protein LBE37_04040, partial [Sphingobacterium sp.]|nr:hypothetical protein [Sphingobacterium sp.]